MDTEKSSAPGKGDAIVSFVLGIIAAVQGKRMKA